VKQIIFLNLLIISCFGFSQKTIIETGRPKQFIVRNAQDIAAKKFKFNYKYVAFNRTPEQLDSIRSLNEKTFDYLAKKYGSDWRNKLQKEIMFELENLNLFQALLLKNQVVTNDNLVYFEKKGKKKYQGYVYPSIEPENISKDKLLQKLTFEQRDGKTVYYGKKFN
jgi:hypothetical protein